jgi:predicted metal-dependent HD superfamily phosphohydrolase
VFFNTDLGDNAMMDRARDYDRFQKLWHHCLLASANDESADVHAQLIAYYSEPQRFYHTLDHIEHCLSLFDKISHELQNPTALELAIWFHDVIYRPGSRSNEQLSADLFMALSDGVFDDPFRNTVYQLVMATLHDGGEVENADAKYMVDIDLSSFGMPWAQFIRDSANLRLEMEDMPDDDFYRKQAIFQEKLFSQPRFFKTDYFYENYETQARQNHSNYVETIRQKTQVGQ